MEIHPFWQEFFKGRKPDKELRWSGNKYRWDLLRRIMGKVERKGSCWIWIGADSGNGYGVVTVYGKRYLVHRVMVMLYSGEYPGGYVSHLCGNAGCVNPSHLYVGNSLTNAADAMQRGRLRVPPEK